MRHRAAGAAAVICLAIIAGCYGGTPSPTGTHSQADAAGPAPTPTPPAVASPGMSPIAEPSPSPAISPEPSARLAPTSAASRPADRSTLNVPADWSVYSWSDGARGIALPPGWELEDVESALTSARAALPSASPRNAQAIRGWLERAAGGALRLDAEGPLPGDLFAGCWITVFVETGDASLDAQVGRLQHWQNDVMSSTGVTTRPVVTPAGPAIELQYTVGPQPSDEPERNARGVDVALRLPDGRSETVSISGYGSQDQIDALATTVIATIHGSPAGAVSFPAAPDGRQHAATAISEAATRLGELDSYRFVARADNRIPAQPAQASSGAAVFRAISRRSDPPSLAGSLGVALGEGAAGGDDIYSGFPVVVTGGRAWMWGQTSLREMPLDQATALLAPLEPAAIIEHLVSPFASAFEWIGTDSHAGVAADHFRATVAGSTRLATALGIDGTVTADLWIAKGGGYLVGVSIEGTDDPGGSFPIHVVIRLDVTAANDPLNVITTPGS